MKISLLLSALLLVVSQTHAATGEDVSVSHPGSTPPIVGSPEYFTGKATVESRFQRNEPARIGGGTVTFEPGARTAWHTHPLGQTLIVTAGKGWVQEWGKPAQSIKTGDMVWIPPNVKHWHGASKSTSMTHIAVSEALDGKSVTWMEKVSSSQYGEVAE